MNPTEILLGDNNTYIVLKFERDGLWVAGEYQGHEIPHKMILWATFESKRHEAEKKSSPTLYETHQRESEWSSTWPDVRSFMNAVHHFFSRDNFKIEGRLFTQKPFRDQIEHTVLTMDRVVIWDFGPLNHAEDAAWRVAFRLFEESTDVIRTRVESLKKMGRWKRYFYRRKINQITNPL